MPLRSESRGRAWAARASLALLVLATTALGMAAFVRLLWNDGGNLLEWILAALFLVLFFWISFSFWTATLGFILCLWRLREGPPPPRVPAPPVAPPTQGTLEGLPMTAILMPVYNEDPARVFSGLRATYESLLETGFIERFDFFVLSDTTEPETWIEEEIAWASLVSALGGKSRVFYRRRARNTQRKSGNIADFCQRWGSHYAYMIILDADSVLSGPTLVEMARRMEQNARLGILQAPPVPVNQSSLLARSQQFASSVYGRIFTAGFAGWAQRDANYWGHNAIIRIAPFLECCGLPRLPGREPLGGEILSHDFVEAAYMRKAGWEIRLVEDLGGGSYEECPSTLTEFAKRDQRWCQGNLQHLRLVFAHGFHRLSRVHLAMGVMSYLSSPLWLLFMVLGAINFAWSRDNAAADDGRDSRAVALLTATMALLLLPKLWAFFLLLAERRRLASHGGAAKAAASVLLETVISVFLAPLLMALHTRFVVAVLTGHSVRWDAQQRSARGITFQEAARVHLGHTHAGVIAALAVGWFAPGLLPWTTPVLVPLILSIPIAMTLSHQGLGRRLRSSGLLLIPEETEVPEVLRRQRAHLRTLRSREPSRRPRRFLQAIIDPALNALHLALLRVPGQGGPDDHCDNSGGARPQVLVRARRLVLHGGYRRLSRAERLAVLSDEASLRWLHRVAWKKWPVERLEIEKVAILSPRIRSPWL